MEYWDAGSTFYATDFWSLWDLGIIFVGVAFFITRTVGLTHHDHVATDVAFDILSIEALFLVPRCVPLVSHWNMRRLTFGKNLLTAESSPLLWHAPACSQGNGRQKPSLTPHVLHLLTPSQTKDFVKFLGLVAILYLGTWRSTKLEVRLLIVRRLQHQLLLSRSGDF